ncbi:unnamed protein product [Heterotrigona itama]|uniref:H15 domain-containing protein n=1 Tax=Heterotrigona itama TaxID=395501 RepID=A0A6V7HA36_9HYME|nr:unnamed protein product [Heterotrigona itama]
MLNEILEEDKRENLNSDNNGGNEDDGSECTACAEENPAARKRICECMHFAENSSRFSLRVMEAMRLLQFKEDRLLPTSTVRNIVDYIRTNYHDDGDLYAQVRTALKQVCSQGFVMKLLENRYHLIGPNAISMNQTTCAIGGRDCTMSSPVKTPVRRRKRIDNGNDYCECETTTDEEEPEPAGKSRKVSTSETKRGSRRRNEEMPGCSCNERIDEDECVCNDVQVQRSMNDDSRMHEERENNNKRTDEEKQRRITRDSLIESSRRDETDERRRRTVDTDDGATTENDRLNVDDIYDELRDRVSPSEMKKREKELKAWLKRCQEECKRQEKRRARNN